jgi:hypothetical protein
MVWFVKLFHVSLLSTHMIILYDLDLLSTIYPFITVGQLKEVVAKKRRKGKTDHDKFLFITAPTTDNFIDMNQCFKEEITTGSCRCSVRIR